MKVQIISAIKKIPWRCFFKCSFFVNASITSLWYNTCDETPYLPTEKGVLKIGKETVTRGRHSFPENKWSLGDPGYGRIQNRWPKKHSFLFGKNPKGSERKKRRIFPKSVFVD